MPPNFLFSLSGGVFPLRRRHVFSLPGGGMCFPSQEAACVFPPRRCHVFSLSGGVMWFPSQEVSCGFPLKRGPLGIMHLFPSHEGPFGIMCCSFPLRGNPNYNVTPKIMDGAAQTSTRRLRYAVLPWARNALPGNAMQCHVMPDMPCHATSMQRHAMA